MRTPHIELSEISGLSRSEERISGFLQRGLWVLCVGGAAFLITWTSLYGDAWQIVAGSIYSATLVLLYFVSGWYHATHHPGRKRVLKVLDHGSIYLLIAGTYTPFTLVTLRGGWGWSLFGVVWGLALLGVLWKIWFVHRFERVSTVIYLAMGWVGVVAIVPMLRMLPLPGLVWLLLGGLSFSVGTIFFLWNRLPYHNVVWHGFVLGGVACHYVAILGYVLTPGT